VYLWNNGIIMMQNNGEFLLLTKKNFNFEKCLFDFFLLLFFLFWCRSSFTNVFNNLLLYIYLFIYVFFSLFCLKNECRRKLTLSSLFFIIWYWCWGSAYCLFINICRIKFFFFEDIDIEIYIQCAQYNGNEFIVLYMLLFSFV
jgi:hypothetical protein